MNGDFDDQFEHDDLHDDYADDHDFSYEPEPDHSIEYPQEDWALTQPAQQDAGYEHDFHHASDYLLAQEPDDDSADDDDILELHGGGGRVKPHNDEMWTSELAAQLTDHGMEASAHDNAAPTEMLADLIQGRQVVLPHADPGVVYSDGVDSLLAAHGGKVAWARAFDVSTPEHPRVLLINSGQPDEGVWHDLSELTDASREDHLSYVAAHHPHEQVLADDSGFDAAAGFFSEAVEWVKHYAPLIASAFAGAGVGDVVGDAFDSPVAAVVGHFATEKVLNESLGLDGHPHAPEHRVFDAGIDKMSDAERKDFLDEI